MIQALRVGDVAVAVDSWIASLGRAMAGWIVKYDGPCSRCGMVLRAGTEAVWDRRLRKMRCIECPTTATVDFSPPPLELGTAGGSARREYERRQSNREAELRGRWGDRVGGWIRRFADEPHSIRAWGLGAKGEELLGAGLASVPDLVVLNDRRVQGTKGNIDHIAAAPAGIFVLDAKHFTGFIEVVDKGSFLRSDLRLMIGGRNRSELAENMGWQLKAVTKALIDAGVDPLPPVTAVLCFVDPSWPIIRRPKSFDGVRIESDRSIVKLLGEPAVLPSPEIDRLARILAEALPPR
jgi:hypothetical protein